MVKITQLIEKGSDHGQTMESGAQAGKQEEVERRAALPAEIQADDAQSKSDGQRGTQEAAPLLAGHGRIAPVLVTPAQLVENVAAPSTGAEPSALVQRPKLELVRTSAAPTLHQEPRTSAAPVRKPVTPLESLGAENDNGMVQQAPHHLPYEWRTTWKTTSTDVRSLWKRLWVRDGNRWRYATRKDRDAGLIPNVVINQEVKSFSLAGAARIKRLGDENVRTGIENLLNRRTVRCVA